MVTYWEVGEAEREGDQASAARCLMPRSPALGFMVIQQAHKTKSLHSWEITDTPCLLEKAGVCSRNQLLRSGRIRQEEFWWTEEQDIGKQHPST